MTDENSIFLKTLFLPASCCYARNFTGIRILIVLVWIFPVKGLHLEFYKAETRDYSKENLQSHKCENLAVLVRFV